MLDGFSKLLSYWSAMSAALALAFDVGFFWGVGIHYFGMFSLGEHTLFAIQAAPYAIAVATCGLVLASVGSWFFGLAPIRVGISEHRILLWSVLIGALLLAIGYTFCVEQYRGFGLAILLLTLLITTLFAPAKYLREAIVLDAVIATLAFTFLLGQFLATAQLERTDAWQKVELSPGGETSNIRILRSGAGSLLFFDPATKEIRIRQWRDIRGVSQSTADW
jgi:signal transduction histidine kinase